MVQKSLDNTGVILNVKLQATCATLYIFRLRVITKTLSQDTRCSGRYSNGVPPSYRYCSLTGELWAGVANSVTPSPASPQCPVRCGFVGQNHIVSHAHPELTSR